jgi:transposase-like protein
MAERDVYVDHSTIHRWVLSYAPELDKQIRPHLKPTNNSWQVDKTYIKVKGEDRYLYRAVDSEGNTLDFLLTAKRDAQAAKRFFYKALKATHTQEPRVINVDKNAAYPKAVDEMKAKEELPESVEFRQNKYLNNQVEQDHRFIKRLTKPGMGFHSFNTARRTLRGFEVMNMHTYWTSCGSRKRRCFGSYKTTARCRLLFEKHSTCAAAGVLNFRSGYIKSGEARRIVCP